MSAALSPVETFLSLLTTKGILVAHGSKHRPATWCHGSAAVAIKSFAGMAQTETFGDVKKAIELTRSAVDAGLLVLIEPPSSPTGDGPLANTVATTRAWLDTCMVYVDCATAESVYYAVPKGTSEWMGETKVFHDDVVRHVYGDKYPGWKQAHTVLCEHGFFPYSDIKIGSKTSRIGFEPSYVFNTYVQPGWRAGLTAADAPAECPALVRKHLMHLVNGNRDAAEYILAWIKSSLLRKNQTWLGLVGEVHGTGKGLLGELILRLHGQDDNLPSVAKAKSDTFADKFNGTFGGKTMVMIDELELADGDTKRVKEMWGEVISIEKKGVDAYSSVNHTNGVFCSNSMAAIKVEAGDRRFSMVDITDKKMSSVMSASELKAHAEAILHDPQLLKDFGAWLLFVFTSQCDPDTVWESETRETMLAASVPEWQRDFIVYASTFSTTTTVVYDKSALGHITKHMPGVAKVHSAFSANRGNYFIVARWFNNKTQIKLTMGPGANPDASPPDDYVAPAPTPGRVAIPKGYIPAQKPVVEEELAGDPEDEMGW